jgi:Rieske Fe-S protein
VLAAGWTAWESLRPLAKPGAKSKIKLGNAGRFAPGTATYVPEGRLWVANPGDKVLALSQKCPHLGCRVPFCESSGRFECPCHGSVFDLGGEYITGPSPRGMDQYAVTQVGNDLYADLTKTITGPPPGANQYLTPAKGPSCAAKG